MVTLGPLSDAMAEVVANWEAADRRRAEASGLITYEQVARWLSPDVRAAVEAGLPDGLCCPDDDIRHGSHAGFTQHRARREQPCRACQRAQRQYRGAAHRLRIT